MIISRLILFFKSALTTAYIVHIVLSLLAFAAFAMIVKIIQSVILYRTALSSDGITQSGFSFSEYRRYVDDLLNSHAVRSMESYVQHFDVSCLEHCLAVSYYSYAICRFLGLDYVSAARGGLLHDLFLYDWHISTPKGRLHAFSHPGTALANAAKNYELNSKECDIIKKHMWPLTVIPPKYLETFIVTFTDKYCAVLETARFSRRARLYHDIVKSGCLKHPSAA